MQTPNTTVYCIDCYPYIDPHTLHMCVRCTCVSILARKYVCIAYVLCLFIAIGRLTKSYDMGVW